MKKIKKIIPLPFHYYFLPMMAIAVCGLLASIYLSISHYRVYMDIGYKSFCAISKSINCDTVSQSPYSIFINVPVPIWGVLGYLSFILMMLLVLHQKSDKKSSLQMIIYTQHYWLFAVILWPIWGFIIVPRYPKKYWICVGYRARNIQNEEIAVFPFCI